MWRSETLAFLGVVTVLVERVPVRSETVSVRSETVPVRRRIVLVGDIGVLVRVETAV